MGWKRVGSGSSSRRKWGTAPEKVKKGSFVLLHEGTWDSGVASKELLSKVKVTMVQEETRSGWQTLS